MPLRLDPQLTTDVVALLDEWAARFFEELDYVREGENATKFAAQMAKDLPQVRADATPAAGRAGTGREVPGGWAGRGGKQFVRSWTSAGPWWLVGVASGPRSHLGWIVFLPANLLTPLPHATPAPAAPQVVVPRTYSAYTSRRVLTTEWLDGEKLSQSKARPRERAECWPGLGPGGAARAAAVHPVERRRMQSPDLSPATSRPTPVMLQADDVGTLVNVGVICYLKQLLDTGFFHADPHPGAQAPAPPAAAQA